MDLDAAEQSQLSVWRAVPHEEGYKVVRRVYGGFERDLMLSFSYNITEGD